jgi:hypothetical protein
MGASSYSSYIQFRKGFLIEELWNSLLLDKLLNKIFLKIYVIYTGNCACRTQRMTTRQLAVYLSIASAT